MDDLTRNVLGLIKKCISKDSSESQNWGDAREIDQPSNLQY